MVSLAVTQGHRNFVNTFHVGHEFDDEACSYIKKIISTPAVYLRLFEFVLFEPKIFKTLGRIYIASAVARIVTLLCYN